MNPNPTSIFLSVTNSTVPVCVCLEAMTTLKASVTMASDNVYRILNSTLPPPPAVTAVGQCVCNPKRLMVDRSKDKSKGYYLGERSIVTANTHLEIFAAHEFTVTLQMDPLAAGPDNTMNLTLSTQYQDINLCLEYEPFVGEVVCSLSDFVSKRKHKHTGLLPEMLYSTLSCYSTFAETTELAAIIVGTTGKLPNGCIETQVLGNVIPASSTNYSVATLSLNMFFDSHGDESYKSTYKGSETHVFPPSYSVAQLRYMSQLVDYMLNASYGFLHHLFNRVDRYILHGDYAAAHEHMIVIRDSWYRLYPQGYHLPPVSVVIKSPFTLITVSSNKTSIHLPIQDMPDKYIIELPVGRPGQPLVVYLRVYNGFDQSTKFSLGLNRTDVPLGGSIAAVNTAKSDVANRQQDLSFSVNSIAVFVNRSAKDHIYVPWSPEDAMLCAQLGYVSDKCRSQSMWEVDRDTFPVRGAEMVIVPPSRYASSTSPPMMTSLHSSGPGESSDITVRTPEQQVWVAAPRSLMLIGPLTIYPHATVVMGHKYSATLFLSNDYTGVDKVQLIAEWDVAQLGANWILDEVVAEAEEAPPADIISTVTKGNAKSYSPSKDLHASSEVSLQGNAGLYEYAKGKVKHLFEVNNGTANFTVTLSNTGSMHIEVADVLLDGFKCVHNSNSNNNIYNRNGAYLHKCPQLPLLLPPGTDFRLSGSFYMDCSLRAQSHVIRIMSHPQLINSAGNVVPMAPYPIEKLVGYDSSDIRLEAKTILSKDSVRICRARLEGNASEIEIRPLDTTDGLSIFLLLISIGSFAWLSIRGKKGLRTSKGSRSRVLDRYRRSPRQLARSYLARIRQYNDKTVSTSLTSNTALASRADKNEPNSISAQVGPTLSSSNSNTRNEVTGGTVSPRKSPASTHEGGKSLSSRFLKAGVTIDDIIVPQHNVPGQEESNMEDERISKIEAELYHVAVVKIHRDPNHICTADCKDSAVKRLYPTSMEIWSTTLAAGGKNDLDRKSGQKHKKDKHKKDKQKNKNVVLSDSGDNVAVAEYRDDVSTTINCNSTSNMDAVNVDASVIHQKGNVEHATSASLASSDNNAIMAPSPSSMATVTETLEAASLPEHQTIIKEKESVSEVLHTARPDGLTLPPRPAPKSTPIKGHSPPATSATVSKLQLKSDGSNIHHPPQSPRTSPVSSPASLSPSSSASKIPPRPCIATATSAAAAAAAAAANLPPTIAHSGTSRTQSHSPSSSNSDTNKGSKTVVKTAGTISSESTDTTQPSPAAQKVAASPSSPRSLHLPSPVEKSSVPFAVDNIILSVESPLSLGPSQSQLFQLSDAPPLPPPGFENLMPPPGLPPLERDTAHPAASTTTVADWARGPPPGMRPLSVSPTEMLTMNLETNSNQSLFNNNLTTFVGEFASDMIETSSNVPLQSRSTSSSPSYLVPTQDVWTNSNNLAEDDMSLFRAGPEYGFGAYGVGSGFVSNQRGLGAQGTASSDVVPSDIYFLNHLSVIRSGSGEGQDPVADADPMNDHGLMLGLGQGQRMRASPISSLSSPFNQSPGEYALGSAALSSPEYASRDLMGTQRQRSLSNTFPVSSPLPSPIQPKSSDPTPFSQQHSQNTQSNVAMHTTQEQRLRQERDRRRINEEMQLQQQQQLAIKELRSREMDRSVLRTVESQQIPTHAKTKTLLQHMNNTQEVNRRKDAAERQTVVEKSEQLFLQWASKPVTLLTGELGTDFVDDFEAARAEEAAADAREADELLGESVARGAGNSVSLSDLSYGGDVRSSRQQKIAYPPNYSVLSVPVPASKPRILSSPAVSSGTRTTLQQQPPPFVSQDEKQQQIQRELRSLYGARKEEPMTLPVPPSEYTLLDPSEYEDASYASQRLHARSSHRKAAPASPQISLGLGTPVLIPSVRNLRSSGAQGQVYGSRFERPLMQEYPLAAAAEVRSSLLGTQQPVPLYGRHNAIANTATQFKRVEDGSTAVGATWRGGDSGQQQQQQPGLGMAMGMVAPVITEDFELGSGPGSGPGVGMSAGPYAKLDHTMRTRGQLR